MTDKSEKKDEKAPEQQEVKEAKKENKCQKKEIDELKARLEEEKENSAKVWSSRSRTRAFAENSFSWE